MSVAPLLETQLQLGIFIAEWCFVKISWRLSFIEGHFLRSASGRLEMSQCRTSQHIVSWLFILVGGNEPWNRGFLILYQEKTGNQWHLFDSVICETLSCTDQVVLSSSPFWSKRVVTTRYKQCRDTSKADFTWIYMAWNRLFDMEQRFSTCSTAVWRTKCSDQPPFQT